MSTSISAERAALAKLGQSLRLRSQWGAARSYTDPRAVSEPATDQFVHISVTNPDSFANDDVHAKVIEKIGISRFPATGISYNRGISMSAKRFEFQPIGRKGAHTGSYNGTCSRSGCPFRGDNVTSSNHNVTGRGYVIMQNVDDPVSAAQLDALARTMAADRLAGFVRKDAKIHGHRCVSTKSCPGDKMWALMGQLKTKIDNYVKNGFGPGGDEDMPLNQTDLDNIYKVVRNVINHPVDGDVLFGNMFVNREVDPTKPGAEKIAAIQELADTKTIGLRIEEKLDELIELLKAEPPA